MNIQEQIDLTDLDMTEDQVRAFFLGVLCAEVPLSFPKAFEEILSSTPEAKGTLEAVFEKLWMELNKNQKIELQKMIPQDSDILKFMETAKDQLDYFLTGMSLSGTHTESCKDKELATFINDLEEAVEDMEDLLSDEDALQEEGHHLKEFLLDIWREFTDSRQ